MANEKFTLEKPTLREVLPEDVVKYLREKYPPRKNGAGTIQKDGVDYITEEKDFFERSEVKECIKTYGLEIIGFLFVLRTKMAKSMGWGIEVSDEDEFMTTKFSIHLLTRLPLDKIDKLCSDLVSCGIIKEIDGSDGKKYITTLQQFYNYEYRAWTREKNNFAQRKSYKKKKEQASESSAESKDQEKAPEISAEPSEPFPDFDDIFNIGFENSSACSEKSPAPF